MRRGINSRLRMACSAVPPKQLDEYIMSGSPHMNMLRFILFPARRWLQMSIFHTVASDPSPVLSKPPKVGTGH